MLKLKKIMGIDVLVDRPRPRISRENIFTVFVKNLPFECSEEGIKEYFDKFGGVHNVRLPRDENRRCKGFSFIEIASKASYDKILKTSHVFEDRKLVVSECLNGKKRRENHEDDSNRRFGRERYDKRSRRDSDDDSHEFSGRKRAKGERTDKNFENRDNRRRGDNRKFDRNGRKNGFDSKEGHGGYKKQHKNKKIVFDEDSE